MHPHLLHARAAAWALQTALEALEAHAMEAVADALAGDRSGEVSIPSQAYGCRRQLGNHGDPTANAALGAWAPGGPNPDAALLGDLLRQLDQAAQHLPGAPGMDPLTRIRQHIPRMRPHVAAKTTEALTHLNKIARERLFLPPDRTPITGACPGCRARGALYLQTSGPEQEWSVVCGTGCLCAGQGCPCGMPVTEAGVGHIWPAALLMPAGTRTT
ncbi:hypothetical protein [Micromonospora chersina]